MGMNNTNTSKSNKKGKYPAAITRVSSLITGKEEYWALCSLNTEEVVVTGKDKPSLVDYASKNNYNIVSVLNDYN
jgi:hypothetical protein